MKGIELSSSQILLSMAFAAYIVATVLYWIGTLNAERGLMGRVCQRAATLCAMSGVAIHAVGLLMRWFSSGHAPVSDMYEYMGFWAFAIMLGLVVIERLHRSSTLGAFAAPTAVFVMAYANLFPHQAQPLIPALQSYWLYIHVTTAALGEGVLTVGFAAALLYLVRSASEPALLIGGRLRALEYTLVAALIAFVVVLSSAGMHALGMTLLDWNAPAWLGGRSSDGRGFGALVYCAFLMGCYAVWRAYSGRTLTGLVSPLVQQLRLRDLDELSYRAIAIGYPIFTLGAIVFAMLWAQEAWGSYWSWDPKETWALITWLYYTVYLHLRLSRGWQGNRAAWLAVSGFAVILFLLIGVNFLIVGLHAYALPGA